jgi:phosphohistidine phosphatase
MRTLLLLRHAKSSWSDDGLKDFARPLAYRGRRAAAIMGGYLAENGIRPALVIASPAVRVRQTLELLLPAAGIAPPVRYKDELYLAIPATILEQVHAAPGSVDTLMLAGHNPGMHALALDLVRDGRRQDITRLATKFPTAALAVITFDARRWSEVMPATGRLERYVTPSSLAEPGPAAAA